MWVTSSSKSVHKTCLTNCLRVIRNAWHFYYALVLVFKVVCGGFGIALLTP
ncbi:DUF3265 domain-containing protein [Vibrio parahaemolyticus]|nr:DUF3265 domain-containing protein [Vibrio parahaemolyticus]MBE4143028.1 DUF3265 domain-containing protein [Vibrio parahaemolyticus]PWY26871.1 DUF3265 domain-containing protein [Vibrio vulnificus]